MKEESVEQSAIKMLVNEDDFSSSMDSSENSEIENRFAIMNDIKKNTKTIFMKKVQ